MYKIMAYSKEKQETLFQSLNNVAALVGPKNTTSGGKQTGLNLSLENENCLNAARTVRDGLFRVVVMGTFSSGKSTFINALIGNKILPVSAKACTAILTYIQYGMNEDKVEVHMKDEVSADGKTVTSGKVEIMSIQSFKEKYQYTIEDEKECLETGTVKRFSNVSYAIMNCKKPLMEGGVRIIDSPGLEDKAVATDMTMDMVQKAQAIIFLAQDRGFSQSDRDYITANFKNAPNNVFFIINKFDRVPKTERGEVLETVKNSLKQVFTKSNGTVDEELMNKRVFGLSALQAIDARRGYEFDLEDEKDIPISKEECVRRLEKSNFLPFEQELERFLTTDERCVAQYQSCFHQMAVTYRAALQKVTSDLKFYETQGKLSEEKKSECLKIIQQISDRITLTEQKFENGSLKIQNAVASLMNQLPANIDKTWDSDLVELKDKVNFNIGDYLRMAVANINPFSNEEVKDEKMKKLLEPFAEIIAEYLSDKVDTYISENECVLNSVVAEVEKELDAEFVATEELFRELTNTIFGSGNSVNLSKKEQSTLQNLLAFVLSDFSTVVKGAAGGKMSWMEWVKKAVLNYLWQALVIATVPLGGLVVLIIEFFQTKNNKNKTVVTILTETKNETVKLMKDELGTALKKVNTKVATVMNDSMNQKCNGIRMKLQDERNRLADIERNLNNNQFSYQAERTRSEAILCELFGEVQRAYQVVMEQPLQQKAFVEM